MEQKKTLWIIAAVSVFLLVVMGAAVILYNPVIGNSKKTVGINPVEKTAQVQTSSASGWTNTNAQTEAVSSPQVNDMFVVSENTTVLGFNQPAQTEAAAQSTTIDLNALKRELASEAALNPNPSQNINITVNLSDKENQAKVEEPPVILTTEYYTGKAKEAEAAEKASSVKKTELAKASSTADTKTAASSSKTSSSTSKASTSSANASTTKAASPVTRFWVQVAAYSNKKTAENARSVLSDKKINSDIYTYEDNKSKLFYRVRVGPFTTKSEAEYWQSKIVEIADFSKAGSYVTSTVN
ncbi:MAG: SPOR domain-containing protein [Treponema sp.]|nr:SPOR domain-containing protein [Treponema sp.]